MIYAVIFQKKILVRCGALILATTFLCVLTAGLCVLTAGLAQAQISDQKGRYKKTEFRLAQFNWLTGTSTDKAKVKKTTGTVTAQSKTRKVNQTGQKVAAWAVNCSDRSGGQFACEMVQNVIDGKSRRLLMLISIKRNKNSKSSAMLFRLFHGIYLPAGLSVKIDNGKGMPIVFQKSDRFGVYAALPLSTKLIANLQRGQQLRVILQLNKGHPIELAGSLAGFTQAFNKIKTLN